MGVYGDAFNVVDVPAPSPAWMVPVVPDENTAPSLHYSLESVSSTFEGHAITVEVPILSPNANPPAPVDGSGSQTQTSLCLVKLIGGKKYAILKRGLVCLGLTCKSCVLVPLVGCSWIFFGP